MAKLKFFYSTMNAGKTNKLLIFNHECIKKNKNNIIFTANKEKIIKSRTGLKNLAMPINCKLNLFKIIKKYKHMLKNLTIDEAQFLTKKHIFEIITIVDILKININTYGLKTDFRLKLFTGSNFLIKLADKIIQLDVKCKCGNIAIANVRTNYLGLKVKTGKKIELNKKIYIPTCRKHFFNFNKK